jgi:ketosteroid isomerase-like protein
MKGIFFISNTSHTMKRNKIVRQVSFLALLLMMVSSLNAQEVQKEINEQVWKPFIKNFNEHNTSGFMTVHSKDVTRSPRDSKSVWNWEEYNKEQATGDQQDIKEKRKRTLELRFTERINSKDRAIDVGIYKTSYLLQNGSKQDYFGRFHVVLRKEKGVWKILVDTDSSEGNRIGEKEFLSALPF